MDVYTERYPYPLALSLVCRHWRAVSLAAPTLWTNIRISDYYSENVKAEVSTYLERSKTCPIFLTWCFESGQRKIDAEVVFNELIIPCAGRWQRITLIAESGAVPDALVTAMGSLDFPVLQDIEIACLSERHVSPSDLTLCRNAPLLRRCRLQSIASLPPLPSNLVVLDWEFQAPWADPFDIDPLLQFLPHVAHSLEHLRFCPSSSEILPSSPGPRIPLPNLKSLNVKLSHIIVEHVLTPNLTHLTVVLSPEANARKVAKMFDGFSAPKLQVIQFYRTPLLPLLDSHDLPSMFPQLESIVCYFCTEESAIVPLLLPPTPKKPSSLQKASKYQPKRREVANPFPNLKELAISDMTVWTSVQAAIEKRLKNGDKSLRKIHLPKGDMPESIMSHLTRWLPKQGIELVQYESQDFPMTSIPDFHDEFFQEEVFLFGIVQGGDWEDDDDDDYDDDEEDFDYWEERLMDYPDYELPNEYVEGLGWNDYDDEDGDEDEDEDEDEEEEDDFYEG